MKTAIAFLAAIIFASLNLFIGLVYLGIDNTPAMGLSSALFASLISFRI